MILIKIAAILGELLNRAHISYQLHKNGILVDCVVS